MDGHGCLPGKLNKNSQPGGFGLWAIAGQLVLLRGLRWNGNVSLAQYDHNSLQKSMRYYATRPFST